MKPVGDVAKTELLGSVVQAMVLVPESSSSYDFDWTGNNSSAFDSDWTGDKSSEFSSVVGAFFDEQVIRVIKLVGLPPPHSNYLQVIQ